MQKRKTFALLDTGASVNVCSEEFYSLVKPIKRSFITLRSASNDKLNIIRKGYLCITINSQLFKIFVYVVKSLDFPIILGTSFLQLAKANFDFSANLVTLHGESCDFSVPLLPRPTDNVASLNIS